MAMSPDGQLVMAKLLQRKILTCEEDSLNIFIAKNNLPYDMTVAKGDAADELAKYLVMKELYIFPRRTQKMQKK